MSCKTYHVDDRQLPCIQRTTADEDLQNLRSRVETVARIVPPGCYSSTKSRDLEKLSAKNVTIALRAFDVLSDNLPDPTIPQLVRAVIDAKLLSVDPFCVDRPTKQKKPTVGDALR